MSKIEIDLDVLVEQCSDYYSVVLRSLGAVGEIKMRVDLANIITALVSGCTDENFTGVGLGEKIIELSEMKAEQRIKDDLIAEAEEALK